MRALLIICACLAAAKVWTQDHLYRTAMSEALVDAYRQRAEQVCGREASRYTGATVPRWTTPENQAITVGSSVAPVMIWDYNNPLWEVRYRHPHLIMTSAAPQKLKCSFDLAVGVAFVQQL